CLLIAFFTLIVSESLCRHSVFDAFAFIFESPFAFFFNYLIILLTFSTALFFPKKAFALATVASVWLILSLINCIVLAYRITPFSAIDFSIAINMLGIIDIYLNLFQLSLIIIGGILFITLFVIFWKKNHSTKIDFKKNSLFVIIVVITMVISGSIGTQTGLLSKKFPSLAEAYKDYGFAYCFSLSIFDVGISEPPEYANDTVDSILAEINNDVDIAPKNKPNILVVQLESFFDINRVSNLVTTIDPIPNFTYLKKNYPHGLITVPSIGGGTANTEFEILTGMNLDHFGPGEYPYKTILQSTTCETPAFTLKEYGYSSHAVHNHTATFYDRNVVYSSLGFDTFIPLEMMHNPEFTTLGWAKDKILTEQITDCLLSTEGQDFIFTVSVQAHGKYPDEELPSEHEIQVELENNTDSENKANYRYYVEQLHETDAFVGEVISFLKTFEEPTVVLFYGDHFPTIYLEEDKLLEGSKYQTDWAIWANYDIKGENKNLNSYQLMAHFLSILGSNLGTTTKLHQLSEKIDNYQNKLEMLEYDVLYGDKITYNGISPYLSTNIEMGVYDIYVTSLEYNENNLLVSGNRFNEYTKIKLDGKTKDTVFVDEHCVMVENIDLTDFETLQVAQITHDRVDLRTSAEYEINSFIPDIIEEQ
ncbi:MAG: LTA synthase family protein, partial [Clostridia bacterium]|nr:LTA synthase family protein [Clostridia bacterium]